MLRKILLIIMLLSFTLINTPFAGSVYMFTEDGNDKKKDITKIENLINEWFVVNEILYESDLEYYEKLEDTDSGNTDYKAYFEFDYNKTLGKWKTDDPVIFYSLKAGNQYAMYWLEVPTREGTFSTDKLDYKDLSHITLWKNDNVYNSNSHAPEPATLFLFGTGLLAMAGMCRKRNI